MWHYSEKNEVIFKLENVIYDHASEIKHILTPLPSTEAHQTKDIGTENIEGNIKPLLNSHTAVSETSLTGPTENKDKAGLGQNSNRADLTQQTEVLNSSLIIGDSLIKDAAKIINGEGNHQTCI